MSIDKKNQDMAKCPKCGEQKLSRRYIDDYSYHFVCSACNHVFFMEPTMLSLNSEQLKDITMSDINEWNETICYRDTLNLINESRVLIEYFSICLVLYFLGNTGNKAIYKATSNEPGSDFSINNEEYECVRIMNKDQAIPFSLESYLLTKIESKIPKCKNSYIVAYDYISHSLFAMKPKELDKFESIRQMLIEKSKSDIKGIFFITNRYSYIKNHTNRFPLCHDAEALQTDIFKIFFFKNGCERSNENNFINFKSLLRNLLALDWNNLEKNKKMIDEFCYALYNKPRDTTIIYDFEAKLFKMFL